jgi:ABC-2 type transport system permease protein
MKLVNIREVLTSKLITFSVWVICSLFLAGYLMQLFGIAKGFGAFQLGSIISSIGLFEMYGNAIAFVADLEGDLTIAYYLTLPGTAMTILLGYVGYYSIIGIVMSLYTIPLGKLILWNQFDLTSIVWGKLILFIVLMNIVLATVTFLVSALVPSMDKFDTMWVRFIMPLWLLGGFQSSWLLVYNALPIFGYCLLLNPMTYLTEGTRAALLGQTGCLSFWLCCAVLIVLGFWIAAWSFKGLKKRLDFV